jgi:hypothetical protein
MEGKFPMAASLEIPNRPRCWTGRGGFALLSKSLKPLLIVLGVALGGLMPFSWVVAQEAAAKPAEADLPNSQEALAARYQRFENTLQQLAEYLRKTDPARADLIVRAIGKSKETRVPDQMQALIELLKQERLGDAISQQQDLSVQMAALLDLLQSEDRRDEIEREKARVQDLIKDVNKLIGQQQDTRSATERGGAMSDLEKRQAKIAEDAKKLTNKIDRQDAEKNASKPSASKNSDGKSAEGEAESGKESGSDKGDESKEGQGKKGEKDPSGDGTPKEDPTGDMPDPKQGESTDDPSAGKPGEKSDGEKGSKAGGKKSSGKPGEEKPGEKSPDKGKIDDEKDDKEKPGNADKGDKPSSGKPSSGKPSQGKPSQGKPSQGKPSQGKPSEGQPSEQSPPSDSPSSDSPQESGDQSSEKEKTPGRDEVEQSIRAMDKAIEELKKKNAGGASDQQDKALTELIKAREKLEEILRQLREEERELMLAALESRFREMLAREISIYNSTMGIASVPEKQRTDRHRSRALELSRQQDELTLEASKALTLLREEGSSIAFPETVEQIQTDMRTIARRLDRADVAALTQQIEKDVIEALEEMVDALRQEMEKLKDEKQKQQQQQQQQKQQKALVNQLAELKLFRSLQFRVNRRTKFIGRLVDGEQATDPDLIGQLRELSLRQEQVRRAAYDLATGRNE